jgi:hypothetical protein
MVERDVVLKQLTAIDAMPKFFGKAEVEELPHILFDGEVINHLVIGPLRGRLGLTRGDGPPYPASRQKAVLSDD